MIILSRQNQGIYEWICNLIDIVECVVFALYFRISMMSKFTFKRIHCFTNFHRFFPCLELQIFERFTICCQKNPPLKFQPKISKSNCSYQKKSWKGQWLCLLLYSLTTLPNLDSSSFCSRTFWLKFWWWIFGMKKIIKFTWSVWNPMNFTHPIIVILLIFIPISVQFNSKMEKNYHWRGWQIALQKHNAN